MMRQIIAAVLLLVPFCAYAIENIPHERTFKVAVILAEPYDVEHVSTSITAQPCKLIPEKTYPNGHDESYYNDLFFCVTNYYKEVSKGSAYFRFTVFDNQGQWYKITNPTKTESYYSYRPDVYLGNDNINQFVLDAKEKASADIDFSEFDLLTLVHAGTSAQESERLGMGITGKIHTRALGYPNEVQLFGKPFAILAEDEPVGPTAHEFGHLLGLFFSVGNAPVPDLLPMGLSPLVIGSLSFTNDHLWDLMSGGSNINDGSDPSWVSSITQIYLGWLTEDIRNKGDYGAFSLRALEEQKLGDSVLRYNFEPGNPLSKHYIFEYRNNALSNWDSVLPEDKSVIVYRVNPNGKSRNGYASAFKTNFSQWKVKIPNTLTANGGVLSVSGETYSDYANLIRISTFGETVSNEEHFANINISSIDGSLLSSKFFGSVLSAEESLIDRFSTSGRLDSTYYFRTPYDILYDKKEELFVAALFALLVLLLAGFVRQRSAKLSRHKNIITKLLVILSCVYIVFYVCVLLYMHINTSIFSECERKYYIQSRCPKFYPFFNPTGIPENLPDLDLHAITPDGRHVGVNYQTGEYENQIAGSIVSGDNQGMEEWIFVPEGETVRYYVSAKDNETFLAEHPEITDTTDSFSIYARTLDPETGIFTSETIENQTIVPEQERVFEVIGTPVPTIISVPTIF